MIVQILIIILLCILSLGIIVAWLHSDYEWFDGEVKIREVSTDEIKIYHFNGVEWIEKSKNKE